MLIQILDYLGTFFVIMAAFLFSSKSAAKPSIRKKAFILFLFSNALWIPMSILIGTYGLLVSQIILTMINIKGIVCIVKGNG